MVIAMVVYIAWIIRPLSVCFPPDKYESIFIWIRWLLWKSNKSVAIKHYQRIWCCKFIRSFHRSYSLTLYQLVDGITQCIKSFFLFSPPPPSFSFCFISLCTVCASLHFIARNGSYSAIVCSIQHFVRINFWHFLHHSSIIITYYSNHVNHCRSGYDVCTIIFFFVADGLHSGSMPNTSIWHYEPITVVLSFAVHSIIYLYIIFFPRSQFIHL